MERIGFVKAIFLSTVGLIGSFIARLIGGFGSDMISLVIFIIADYITGLIVAGVFNNSNKTKTGALNSNIGFKGLCKKGAILLVVIIANRLDIMLGSNYIRTAVIIAFCVNELISITENVGLMGLPLPNVIVKAIDVLKSK